MSSEIVTCPDCGKRNRVPGAASGVPRCADCHSALPWIATATDEDATEVVDNSTLPVLLDLWAPWCGPCRMVSPALEDLARSHAGRIKLVKVDVDQAPGVAARFEVMGIPTLVVLDRGRIVARQTGAAPAPALQKWLEQALAELTPEGAKP
jgi:thioredoxin 2